MTTAEHTNTTSYHGAPVPTPGRRGVRMRVMALVAVMATVLSMFVLTPPAGASTAPDAPSAVTGVGFDRSVVVWFTAPASNGGSAVTGYTVTATDSTTPANGGQTCTTTNPNAGCTIAGLTNADSYTFTVTATNAVGTSAPSSASAAITPAVVTATQIDAGSNHTCARLSNTTAECWGYNSNGQLGDNTTTDRYTPVQGLGVGGIGLLTGVKSISAGGNQTCAVVSGGADCWGNNSNGQLGDNTTTQRNTPVQVLGVGGTGFLSDVTSISAGLTHTCAVASSGADCWGNNSNGHLGDNTTTYRNAPVQVLGVGGTGFLSGVTSITAGSSHTCALASSGADCWGRNTYGQLGDNTTTQRNAPVAVIAAPPTSPSVTAVASHTATVSWTASSGALTYTVTATDTTTPANGGQTCTTGSLSCTVSGLTNGDTYTFAVTAYNGFITSAASASTGGSVISGVPDAPTSLVATAGNDSVSIAFVPGADGGSTITKYQYKIGSGIWLDAPAGTSSPVAITGMVNYVVNSIKLRAYNSAGGGTESSSVSVTPKVSAPVITSAYSGNMSGVAARGIVVAFNGVTSPGATMASYRINAYAKGTNTIVSTVMLRARDRAAFVGGLTQGVEYDIRVIGYLTLTGTPLLTRATLESTTRTVRV